jgi:hypothetical protein
VSRKEDRAVAAPRKGGVTSRRERGVRESEPLPKKVLPAKKVAAPTKVEDTTKELKNEEKVNGPMEGPSEEGDTQAARGAGIGEGVAAGVVAARGEVEGGRVEERVSGDMGDDQGQASAVDVAREQEQGPAVAAATAGVGEGVVGIENMQVQEKAGVGVGPQERGELAVRAAEQGEEEGCVERESAGRARMEKPSVKTWDL